MAKVWNKISTSGFDPPKLAEMILGLHITGFTITDFQKIKSIGVKGLPQGSTWIFLTGDHGQGKTSILQALAVAGFGTRGVDLVDPKQNPKISLTLEGNGHPVRLDYEHKNKIGDDMSRQLPGMVGYGPARLDLPLQLSETEERERINNPVSSLLQQGGGLLNIETWLKDLKLELTQSDLDPNRKTQIEHLSKDVLQTLARLLPHVDEVVLHGAKVLYLEKGRQIPSSRLSAGHKSIVAMIGDMIVRLSRQQTKISEVSSLEGIVLIDELENHLHPRWQMALPALLTKSFPKVHFIASTHSPIPLLGAPANASFLKVSQDESDDPTVEWLDIVPHKLMPNSILSSPLFDFDPLDGRNPEQVSTHDRFKVQIK